MNQKMYINYSATIYFLTSIYADNLDSNLKNAIRNTLHYLHGEVDKYVIPHQDHTLKNFKARDLNYIELLKKTKQVVAILAGTSKNEELVIYAKEILEYVNILQKENMKKEILEGKNNEKY